MATVLTRARSESVGYRSESKNDGDDRGKIREPVRRWLAVFLPSAPSAHRRSACGRPPTSSGDRGCFRRSWPAGSFLSLRLSTSILRQCSTRRRWLTPPPWRSRRSSVAGPSTLHAFPNCFPLRCRHAAPPPPSTGRRIRSALPRVLRSGLLAKLREGLVDTGRFLVDLHEPRFGSKQGVTAKLTIVQSVCHRVDPMLRLFS